ncbi:MAG: rod shape-determining protein MreC [Pedobacter sp.]|nr:MAG: rod shape-determining protein MreC [Pedobacter sp.]
MRNIFLFIRRYIVFLSFLVLQALSLWFLFRYNRSHRAKGLGMANEVTGWVSTQYNKLEDFVRMNAENKRVQKQNDSLRNLLLSNFIKSDTSVLMTRDSLPYDTLGHYRQYYWRDAQVVYNTVNSDKNYVQINRGSQDGIKDDMGVFSSNGGLVGKVVNTSEHFSQVMSILHVQNNVDAVLRKTGNAGRIAWDGKDPNFLIMTRIAKSDSAVKGDTIVTGRFSQSYPPGKLIGTVADVINDKSTNFITLKIKPVANFGTLQQVSVVENLFYNEQMQLNQDTERKLDLKKSTK